VLSFFSVVRSRVFLVRCCQAVLASMLILAGVSQSVASTYDGPAELPRVYMNTALVDTPAPGRVTIVNAGQSLQDALNNASCGDTIELQAGATFTGLFTFPAKSCDDGHWIILRTNSLASQLPPEQTRITPCYAGISSLPSRPAYNCSSPAKVMARLVSSGANGSSGPLLFAMGANHYRLIGLEITRQSNTNSITNLAWLQNEGPAHHIIFDRVWMHGVAQYDTRRGIDLGGSTYVAVIDSYFSDFHCTIVTGMCTDSQAIVGGMGNLAMGPYKIVNNYLEASGENILFGGGGGTRSPTDIEIRRNHFYKPRIWQKGQAGYVGGKGGYPFLVKNHFELKNGQRILFEANLLEYNWGGFSQLGYSILLTPKNQSGACAKCQVTDVTVRYSRITHVGAAFQIANVPSGSALALDGERYSIHDVIADDINSTAYLGAGVLAQISEASTGPILKKISMNHVTAFPDKSLFYIGSGATTEQMQSFTFTNSLVNAGQYPVWSTGGTNNCAAYNVPIRTFGACFNPYVVTDNAIIACSSNWPPSSWPGGNMFPSTVTAVEFVSYNGANGGNYQLRSTSNYHGTASDGKDVGADVVLLNQQLVGVS
jgi:hypothetical protein